MTDAKRLAALEREGEIRRRSPDRARARSLAMAAQKIAHFACRIPLNSESAGVVFRELYECLRQVGDAKLWLCGYEALKHTASMEALEDEIGQIDYMRLDRLRTLRHGSNYRGYAISEANAQEILVIWKKWGEKLAEKILSEAQ